MKRKTQINTPGTGSGAIGLGLVVATCASALAGSATYDFNAAPPADLNFVVSQADAGWRDSGGVNNSGYIALFDSINSMTAAVLIPDFDAGMVVKAFTFEVDLRVGNATGNDGRPADGFSISYARSTDPVVADLAQEPPVYNGNNFSLAGAPENGTKTGLAISFDTWSGNTQPDGGADIEGIMINLDGKVVPVNGARGIPMATRNGSCTDATSMQTGPYNADLAGAPDNLCWARLKVELNEAGEVTVTWKGTVIANKIATGFSPSPGRIVFAGRTGGANENTHIDNLTITTVPADSAVIGSAVGIPTGFSITVADSGPSVFNAAAAGAITDFKLNGKAITPLRTSKDNGITTLFYSDATAPIPVGSANTVTLAIKDTRGTAIAKDVTFTGVNYVTLEPAWAAANVDKTKPGFTTRIYQVEFTDDLGVQRGSDVANDGVSIAAGERMLHGDLGPNTADLTLYTGTGGTYRETKAINYNAFAGNIGSFADDGTVAGMDASPNVPGLPGSAPREGGNDDCVMEILTYVEFTQAGSYQMGFNSDDGFRMTAYANPQDVLKAPIVCQFDNGRGATDTTGWVYVSTPGSYGFRTIWMEGGGGANLEFFAINEAGLKALVNDTTTAGALKAYAANNGTVPSAVSFVDPPRGSGRPFLAGAPIVVEVTDGSSAASNLKFVLNGTEVTPTVTKSGKVSKAVYTPAGVLPVNNTLVVNFTDGTATYSGTTTFTATGGALIPPSMALKAADVNKGNPGFLVKTVQLAILNNGATAENYPGNTTEIGEAMVRGLFGWPNVANLAAFTGPGGAYVETGAINYNGSAGNIGTFTDDGAYAGLAAAPNMPGIPGSATAEAGIANYAVEIRTVLDLAAGTYHFGVNSDDGFRVIVGDGKEAYTLPIVCGEFSGGRGADNWAFTRFSVKVTQAGLYPFRLVFEEGGGGNNVEWFQITQEGRPDQMGKLLINDTVTSASAIKAYQYPVNSTGPTYVKSFAPGRSSLDSAGSVGRAGPDATVKAVIVDGSTPVVASTVSMQINGTAVTPTVTKAGTENTISYQPAAGFAAGSTNTVALTFGDRTVGWTFVVGLPATPVFWIEAADFDYNSGQTKAEASVMPYAGGAYAGLGATAGTDYKGYNTADNPYYRYPNTVGLPISFANDRDRGGGEVVVNFRPGWMGSSQWFNYTRTLPTGKFNVYAGLSSGTAGDAMRGNLASVTAGTETILGAFSGTAPGGWGNNALLPLKDVASTNSLVALELGGTKTLRYNDGGGDWDFMLFVPVSAEVPKISEIKKNADGTVTITWAGGGTLQAAEAITGPWQDVTGATSPYTFTPSAAMLFGRIRQ